jgi:ribonuclease HI
MNKVVVYTDGACRGNPGPGGWGAILMYKDIEKTVSGFESHTTNNRMELMAAVEALKILKRKCIVELYTDSQYVKQGMSAWIFNWRRNGWVGADKKPIKNQDLWMALDNISKNHEVHWHWVKGHVGHEFNERADQLARQAIDIGLEQ